VVVQALEGGGVPDGGPLTAFATRLRDRPVDVERDSAVRVADDDGDALATASAPQLPSDGGNRTTSNQNVLNDRTVSMNMAGSTGLVR